MRALTSLTRGLTILTLLALLPTGGAANQVVDWNEKALEVATAAGVTSGAVHARTLAIVHLAMHDALNAITPRYRAYAVAAEPSPDASPDATVAGAAYGALSRLFPERASLLEPLYHGVLTAIPDGEPKIKGFALGERVAAEMVSRRAADHFTTNLPYAWHAPGPGVFQPVPPLLSLTAALTGIARATPFALETRSQFRAPGPPALASAEWSRDFNEVKSVGAANSPSRTADQTAAAHFWREPSSTQAWNRVARPLAAAQVKDLWDSTRLFALLNMAMADTAIAVFESKYQYHFWRPITAIRQAEADGNPDTTLDTTWSPLLSTPSHPEYPSGHAGYCAAAATVMAFLFGDRIAFSTTSPTSVPPDVVRSHASFSQLAQECSESRVHAGIHFRTACEHAATQGRQVGEWVTQRFLQPVTGR